ncbi:MAG: N-acetyl-gamma-glutamyl-phosphate reductase [Lentisphaerae bacterium]|mgnify:CR=1 FL=1|jgi:N-acetyl-gamma-glutamyl-phosphate reductase|nr:N-acetyl-gamma-glutamyl-phosphate reductase [Lentisphaerota bacterium]
MNTRVAIVGASGYAGEELLRILLKHPNVTITCITSRQNAGRQIGEFFPRFVEADLAFSTPDADDIAAKADIAFLALPHGLAAEFAEPLVNKGIKVIDISADFRLRDTDIYKQYYKNDHPAPALLHKAVYGLPELYRGQLKSAQLVACAGCYVTSVLLPMTAMLKAGIIETNAIEAISLSGVTGAGRKVDLPYIYPECNESMRPYAVTGHRHLPEMEQELAIAAGVDKLKINFIPHLIPVNRGIHSTILAYAKQGVDDEVALDCLNQTYKNEPFVRILKKGQLADTKHVTMTNFCEIGCAYDKRTNRIIVSSVIDNLTKGASGQAVQIMNIICGYDETTGL